VNADSAKPSARALADLEAGVIIATVQIAAPPERVFRALTDPRELMHWWGTPETYRAHRWESDLRVGGKWIVEGKGADGHPYSVYGTFLEISSPTKLVHTWNHDWDPHHPETRVAFALDDIPGGTRITLRHDGFLNHPHSCTSHSNGWERVLTWLESYLEKPVMPGL
jgi:uncharacterized protein YndB with AHSA1/START domain